MFLPLRIVLKGNKKPILVQQYMITVSRAISFTLYLGGITLAASEEGRRTVTTTTAIVHPNYNENNLNNDIALIRLPEPVSFTGILCFSNFAHMWRHSDIRYFFSTYIISLK